ncbi:Transcriptional regulator, DeoR family [uncultured Alphaproteobacteria bacterium]|uniref:Transcriptional regulator, DeoR family n=1 Tax=uncultured Alphaproteobacteria bacterium TaxID=91750 RepID=A0A212KKI4_9PROT|nr:Transcriptional regulator, DeoR family [uncultured Alphaproteobacteria bacterium]
MTGETDGDEVPTAAQTLRYRDAPRRRQAIVECLQSAGYIGIDDLARRLGVSEMTVRRDARRLHREGRVVALRGALKLPTLDGGTGLPAAEYRDRAEAAQAAKMAVGRLAVADIRHGDVIAVDAGTTALEVVRALPRMFDGTVVTHSIPAIDHLLGLPSTKTIGLGGDVYRPSCAFVGSVTVETASRLRVRTFYLGAAAVDARGIYASADTERLVKQTLMSIADRVVLVIDHRKFEATAPVFLCSWGRLSMVISDRPPPPEIRAQLREQGVEVVLPPAE